MDKADAIAFLKELLNIPSVNGVNPEAEIARFIKTYFEKHGIDAQLHIADGERVNVIAEIGANHSDKTLIWNGHLDTVPYGDRENWTTDPERALEKNGRLYARGASDMKSGLAAMVYAMCVCKETARCHIQFFGTCDEEKDGLGASAIVKDLKMEKSDYLIIGEPTGLLPGTAHKGCLWLQLDIRGKTGHAAYPKEGINAIEIGFQIAEKIKGYVETFSHPLLGPSTAQVTIVDGGHTWNMTPDTCRLCMDIRMVPGLKSDMIFGELKKIVQVEKRLKPGLEVGTKIGNNREAFEIDEEDPLLFFLRERLKQINRPSESVGINYFTDASILDYKHDKRVLLFGPGEAFMAHKPDEYVEIDKYLDAIALYESMANGFQC